MNRPLTRLASGLTGATVTLLLLVGPPWLLTTLVGPPIPTSWPDLDTLRSIATVGVTDSFVITTLAVIIWIAWAQLAVAIAAELAAAFRRRPAIRLPLLPGAQPFAARLVAATLLLVTLAQPRPLAVAAPLDLTVATAAPAALEDAPAVTASPVRDHTSAPTPSRTIVVGERDSWWSLAETHLDDGIRWRELRDLNIHRTQPDGTTIHPGTEQLQPGWTLLIPANGHDDQTANVNDQTATPDPDSPAEEWVVQPGDHFWHIAKSTLEQAWGRTPDDGEIVPYWRQLIDTNRHLLAPPRDPDLIHPGQRFELPATPADPTTTAASELAPEARSGLEPADELDTTRPAPVPEQPDPTGDTDPAVDGPQDPASAADVSDSWQRALTNPAPTAPAADVDRQPPGDAPATGDHPRTGWGIPTALSSGLAAAMFLAAGTAALVRRRRRLALQQPTAAFRLPTLAPEVRDCAQRLTVAAPTDEVLDDLVTLLCSVPETVEPVLVVAHDDGAVSLVFDNPPDQAPPTPWVEDRDGDSEPVRWTARLGDRGERRSYGMPLLVTLGRLGTSVLLANLGAMRHLAVDGPDDQVRTRLRAVTLEVATSRTAGPVEVTVVGDHLIDGLDQVRHVHDPAEEIAAARREVDDRVILDDRIPRLIVAHHGAPAIEIPQDLAPLCGTITANPATTGWRLEVDGTDGWLQLPDGTREQVTLPDVDPDLVVQALEPADPGDVDHGQDDGASADGHQIVDVTEPGPYEAQPAAEPTWCEVGLLGPFTVTKGDEPVDGLTTISRQMLAYLVTHRNTSTGKLEDAVWQGQAARGGGQRVRSALGRLRTQLGNGPDGSPLIPPRKAGNDSIVLPDIIGSDLDRAFQLLTAARHETTPRRAQLLLDALRLVRGEPFEDLPVSWAMDTQQRAIVQLQEAAATAAQLLRDAGQHDQAEEAIRHGLQLCDPCEPLYIEWARLEHTRGRTDQIPRLWRRLKQRYADDADEIAGLANTPTSDTELEFMTLM